MLLNLYNVKNLLRQNDINSWLWASSLDSEFEINIFINQIFIINLLINLSLELRFPLIIASPMGLFYDEICGMCMPVEQYNHMRDYYKIFLFLILYLIPALCRLVWTRKTEILGFNLRNTRSFIWELTLIMIIYKHLKNSI